MKLLVSISIILAISLYEASGMTMSVRGGMYKDPNYPGMCMIQNNMVLAPGEHKNYNGECLSLTCYQNGQITVMGCMKQGMRPGCVEGNVINPNAPYPDCCKREIKCKTDYYSK